MSTNKQAREVQRYAQYGVDMMEWSEGGYVLHSDYLALLDELEAAEKRIAELESRSVKLPEGYATRLGHPINEGERGVMIPKEGGRWLSRFDVEHALRVAGITVKGE